MYIVVQRQCHSTNRTGTKSLTVDNYVNTAGERGHGWARFDDHAPSHDTLDDDI